MPPFSRIIDCDATISSLSLGRIWVKLKVKNCSLMFYPWVMYILAVNITEAFGLPKLSLFFNYKVVLFLCCLRIKTEFKLKSCDTKYI